MVLKTYSFCLRTLGLRRSSQNWNEVGKSLAFEGLR